eukprot:36244_1
MSYKSKGTRIPTRDPDSEFEEGEEMDSIEKKQDQDEVQNSLGDEASAFIVDQLETNTKGILFPAFAITGTISGIAVVLGFFGLVPKLAGLIVILILTLVTSYIAMYAVYKWGHVDEYVQFYEHQNTQFSKHTGTLKETQVKLKKEVDQMQQHVHNLKNETMELEQCIVSFEELHDALKEVVGEDEQVLRLIDQLNQQYSDMKILFNHKEKAELLLGYYRVQFGGQLKGKFDANDYQRFLGRLNHTTRNLYEAFGGFGALDVNKDGNVDPNEFIRLTNKLLENNDSAFVEMTQLQTA